MPRRYRGLIAAIAGLALAAPCEGEEAKANKPQPEAASSYQLERIASAVEKLPKTEAPDRGCQPGQDNRQSDLCAQWKAADAASDAAWWAMITFCAGVGGLVIGGGTLIAAWRAAHWAKKAADHTETGANAAIAANEFTQSVSGMELRAYVVVIPKGIEQSIGEMTFRGQVEVHNIGRTPANKVSCKVRMKEAAYKEDNFRTQRFRELAARTLLPDARMRQGSKEAPLVTEFFRQPSGFIFVYGRVDYTDYLGIRRSTKFCHRYNKSAFQGEVTADPATETQILISADKGRHHIHGNDAN